MSRCNSSGKILLKDYSSTQKLTYSNNPSRDNSRISGISGVSQYLDRRHNETKEKIEKLKMEKFLHDAKDCRYTPNITKNSRKIIDNIVNREHKITESKITQKVEQPTFRQNNLRNAPNKPTHTVYDEVEAYKRIIERREIILKERDANIFNNVNINLFRNQT